MVVIVQLPKSVSENKTIGGATGVALSRAISIASKRQHVQSGDRDFEISGCQGGALDRSGVSSVKRGVVRDRENLSSGLVGYASLDPESTCSVLSRPHYPDHGKKEERNAPEESGARHILSDRGDIMVRKPHTTGDSKKLQSVIDGAIEQDGYGENAAQGLAEHNEREKPVIFGDMSVFAGAALKTAEVARKSARQLALLGEHAAGLYLRSPMVRPVSAIIILLEVV